jgi:hypothetical protein
MASDDAETLNENQDDAPLGVEIEDDEEGGIETLTEPFDPTKIRIETRPMTVDLLIGRIKNEEVDLAPSFQRAAGLWKDGAQSRLIESLLIRIPIPAFYMDATNEDCWLVVDGLQRLTVLKRYIVNQEFGLTELEFLTNFKDKKFSELPRPMQRRILETQVVAYLIQPGTPEDAKFSIFKRVNTGGLPLSPQEIRHALNQGTPAEFIKRLAETPEFVQVAGRYVSGQRMADRECTLRFLAFTANPFDKYAAPNLDRFLNEQMRRLKTMSEAELMSLERRFVRAMSAAYGIFENDAFRKRKSAKARRQPVNKALFEAWSVNLDALSDEDLSKLVDRRGATRAGFVRLMNESPEFELAISQGTGDVSKVRLRFSAIKRLIHEVIA